MLRLACARIGYNGIDRFAHARHSYRVSRSELLLHHVCRLSERYLPPAAMPPKSLKRSLVGDLASMPGVCKTGLAEALRRMHAHGVLSTSIGEGTQATVRIRLAQPLTDLRETQSPYGPLIRPLPDFGSSTVEVVNPHAYLYHLAKVSDELGDLLLDASVGGTKELRIVLYMDSICPGNPIRPDKSRIT